MVSPHQRQGGERCRYPEHRRPINLVDQGAAEEWSQGHPDTHRAGPDAEGFPTFLSREDGGQRGQCLRQDQRAADALQAASDDQGLGVGRKGNRDRGERKEGQADGQDSSTTKAIAQRAREQQQSAEQDQVGVDHPERLRLRHLKDAFDRGQRRVHDGRVERDNRLRTGEHREDEPAPSRADVN